jgi:hypothetical protein
MRTFISPANRLRLARHTIFRQPQRSTTLSQSAQLPLPFSPTHTLKSHAFSSNSSFNAPITKKIKYLSLDKKESRILLVKKSNDERASKALESLISSVSPDLSSHHLLVKECIQ